MADRCITEREVVIIDLASQFSSQMCSAQTVYSTRNGMKQGIFYFISSRRLQFWCWCSGFLTPLNALTKVSKELPL